MDNWDDYMKNEFGSLIWGMAELVEMMGADWSRLEPPIYDLLSL